MATGLIVGYLTDIFTDTLLRGMESFALCVSKSADLMTSASTPVVWTRRGPEPGSLLKVRRSQPYFCLIHFLP